MQITMKDFWMGRDFTHPGEFTAAIVAAGEDTVAKVNRLLALMEEDGVEPLRPQPVASGWRPAGVNSHTSNAAAHSTHITAQACDLHDDESRSLARWALSHPDALADIGLWMEDPQWCPTWLHVQTLAPKSGHRVYVPSTAAPLVAKLVEQGGAA
jgi:hypothetical protein